MMEQNPEIKRRENIERTIISNCLMDNKILPITITELLPDNFYFNDLKIIFVEIINAFQSSKGINLTLLIHSLAKEGNNSFQMKIMNLMDEYITSANQLDLIKILQEYKLREISLKEFKESIRKIKKNEDIFSIVSSLGDFSFNVLYDKKQNNEYNFSNITKGFKDTMSDLAGTERVKSGLIDLDELTNGFFPKTLTFIGARPSVGKTALGLSMFNDIIFRQNKSAGFFTLEMGFFEVYSRMIAMETKINLTKIINNKLSADEQVAVEEFHNQVKNANFVIDDSPALDEVKLRALIQIYKQKYNLDIVFIDYIGLMRSAVRKQTKTLELGHVSNTLKQIAKQFDIPIVCLVQLNRDVEKRAGQRPTLADLRDSGELEQDADSVIFIHRLANKPDEVSSKGILQNEAELIVAKQRNGKTGVVKAQFIPEITKYMSQSTMYESNPNDIPKQSYFNETKNDTDFNEGYKSGGQFPF